MKTQHQILPRFSTACGGLFLGACLLGTVSSASAVTILGNSIAVDTGSVDIGVTIYPPPNPTPTIDTQFAVGFTMPGQSYTLTDVLLRLQLYDGPTDAIISLMLDSGSNTPGTLHATLNNPASVGPGINNYTFTPSGTVTLAANTKYWLLADHDLGGYYRWQSASDAPTGVAAYDGFIYSGDNGSTYLHPTGTSHLRFEIHGEVSPPLSGGGSTSVPDAGSTLPLLGLALTGLAWFHRRRAAE